MNNYESRLETYFKLSSAISSISTGKINQLLEKDQFHSGWGTTHRIAIKNRKVFVKKFPLTKKEYSDPFNTSNHFNIPLFYNYGVGSAGFGAFRELCSHIKTTNWVLEGKCQNFPLMYHYRIVPRSGKVSAFNAKSPQLNSCCRDMAEIYTATWG